jgi:hypothetical protein
VRGQAVPGMFSHPTTAKECIMKIFGDTAEVGFLDDWKATGQEVV